MRRAHETLKGNKARRTKCPVNATVGSLKGRDGKDAVEKERWIKRDV